MKKRKRNLLKKAICCFVAAEITLNGLPEGLSVNMGLNAQASEALVYTSGNASYTYQIASNSYIGILSYTGSDSIISIPEEIDGLPVKYVAEQAMMNNTILEEITLPYSIESIGRQAFYGCTNIKKVQLPENLQYISNETFKYCTSLEEIELPDSLKILGEEAFQSCQSLESITLPNTLDDFGEGVFSSCKSLKNVIISDGNKILPVNTFYGCINLTEISIPASVEKIGSYAFAETGLTSLELANDDLWISARALGDNIEEGFVVRGNIGTKAEKFAKKNFVIFQSFDASYEVDYANQTGCFDSALANYQAILEYLNEYYIEKYPDMALGLMYGLESDREFFKEVSAGILEEHPDIPAPLALYNWMNENVFSGVEYGYPVDVYHFRNADCMGNAQLLCELLRSTDIPAVILYGWTGDMENIVTELMLKQGKVTQHAWVLAYYGEQWMLLDSAMNRVLYDEEEICRWYYTLSVDEDIVIYHDEYNFNVRNRPSVYFKDGKYFAGDSEIDLPLSGCGVFIDPESVKIQWNDLSDAVWADSGQPVILEPGKEGWVADGINLYYMKKNTCILTKSLMEENGKTYYFSQNGYAFDISDLGDDYKVKYGIPVVEKGKEFQLSILLPDSQKEEEIVWESMDETIATIDSEGNVTAVGEGTSNEVSLIANGWYSINIFVDEFVTEISMPQEITLKVGETEALNVTADKESVLFDQYLFQSSDSEIVNVNILSGQVTALQTGVAEITAVCCDGSGIETKCRVIVTSDDMDIQGDAGGEGVYIEYQKDIFQEDIILNSEPITDEDKQYEEIKDIVKGDFRAYDITITNQKNEKIQPNGKVIVRIPCPSEFNGKNSSVYYAAENGRYIDMEAVYSSGFLMFETNHFSTYLVMEGKLEETQEIVYGDMNGDGSIDTKDAVLIKKYLAAYTGLFIDLDASDVNVDGKIDSKDAVMLLRYLAGYDVKLGE